MSPFTAPRIPEITPDLVEAARRSPNAWVYAIDPELDPAGSVPPQGIAGAWKTDENGRIVGEFVPNSAYSPSPTALGWPVAETLAERAIQMAIIGLWPSSAVTDALGQSTVYVAAGDNGESFAYTTRQRAGERDVTPVAGGALLGASAGRRIVVDPGLDSTFVIAAETEGS